ncbi:thiamine pyrophosphate-dependent enzyme [Streptomyces sp. NPDC046931]|uniref:thiamine pyrophosphate-dependent enzyme n=1 Tax=Streptomyces sp. NPDC046931 TaxID=3154806 RepID=UPI0033DEC310
MHLFDADRRFYGGNAIAGGGIPLAARLALAEKMRGGPGVACCFFGDGALAEGEFHETANLATLWGLPLLLACEDNLYAMGTRSTSSAHRPTWPCAPPPTACRPGPSTAWTSRVTDGLGAGRRRHWGNRCRRLRGRAAGLTTTELEGASGDGVRRCGGHRGRKRVPAG